MIRRMYYCVLCVRQRQAISGGGAQEVEVCGNSGRRGGELFLAGWVEETQESREGAPHGCFPFFLNRF